MNINDLLPVVWEYYEQKKLPTLFNNYYKLYTCIKPDYTGNHMIWIDRMIDSYKKFKSYEYTISESTTSAVIETLQELEERVVDEYYKSSKKEGD